MLIAAVLIELAVPDASTIKARRSLANSVRDRLRQRFNLSVAEVGDPGDREFVCVGCVAVGIDPRHLRQKMERAVEFVERLGLAEVVGDDILIARLDELEEVETDGVAIRPAEKAE